MGKDYEIVIRRMVEGDVPALVGLHSEVFPEYNATLMGVGYLESLYLTLACHAACISIVALEGQAILGWIGGVVNWPSFEKALTRRSLGRVPAIFFSILKNRPGLLTKTFSVLWRVVFSSIRGSKPQNASVEGAAASQGAALLVIGVAPQWQNQNLGQLMMEHFHRRLLSEGFTTCTLHTFSDNEAGKRAFQKAGYKLFWGNDAVNHYIKRFN